MLYAYFSRSFFVRTETYSHVELTYILISALKLFRYFYAFG
jgi:hypothetical protein